MRNLMEFGNQILSFLEKVNVFLLSKPLAGTGSFLEDFSVLEMILGPGLITFLGWLLVSKILDIWPG